MIGRTISHYRVLEKLGAGGMGVIYRAEDTRLGRQVALKFLSDALLKDETALERFRREARSASALNHPNICTIYDIDEVDGVPFLAMELLEGTTLRERLEDGPLPDEELIDVAIEFADALVAAHGAHIIHRDLKPANLFLTQLGHLKILDFGLAKLTVEGQDDSSQLATAARDLTATATTMGTVSYMSPEQARGDALDARTDLFSFGAVLYEMTTGARAFDGHTTAMVYDAILHNAPAPMSRGHQALQPIVDKALQKNREHRYQSAADIRADLKRLKHESAPATVTVPVAPHRHRIAGMMLGIAIIGILAIVALWRTRSAAPHASKQMTIAVLPFTNLGGNQQHDYLRLAVPDELITILSHSKSLAVRPFAMTRKYTGEVDPQETGRALKVANVITGDYRASGDRIGLTVEAIDVEANNVLWRDSVDVAGGDLIALRNELANRVRSGLFPRLNIAEGPADPSRPRNDEAYGLFLRAAAIPFDPAPNKEALTLLERAVQLDPSYAPAWNAIGVRSYYDYQYAAGGEQAVKRALFAHAKALAIDPELIGSMRGLVVMQTERGDLEGAYKQAREMVRRRRENADAHFSLSYVLRYAGVLDEAARECDTALTLDRTNRQLRSCGLTFIRLGQYKRADEFASLDRGSVWSDSFAVQSLLYQGRTDEAATLARKTDPSDQWKLVLAIAQGRPQPELDQIATAMTKRTIEINDGENLYFAAGGLAMSGHSREAIELLRLSIARNYCSFPSMDSDPGFVALRKMPGYAAARAEGQRCYQRFIDWRASLPPSR